ncbi:TonB-dependent receptor [Alteromonas lipotrueiana]|uniref:TonB-dependent receptor n=1 Tax=Alteromonas lipotrueiana TaxID=2803815 RepID=UPI001C442149|nr:TonB-dependent receptor [Alteromonas lipotrueiana]
MYKRKLIASSILLACSPVILANTISGTVTNEAGNPVADAKISVEGSRKVVYTDNSGRYLLENVSPVDVHLHVSSSNYLHGDRDLGAIKSDKVIDFVLASSSVENITVTATAMQSSILESVTPVSVLGADELRKRQAPTLGETLKSTPGVHSTYYGPVSSSPVIRGNDGPRVKIVQNGLDVSDVSRIGPDHNVAANTSSATQVEVLRGPATLQYGSGAIGGVVNVVDKRIPESVPQQLEGEAEARYSTADNGKFAKADITGGKDAIAYHFDGFTRDTQDIEIPGFASAAPDGDEPYGVLENSSMETTGFTGGLSYVQDEGYIGFAVEGLDNLYGVPGHAAHGEEEAEEHDDELHSEEAHVEGTQIDVEMTRYQLAGELYSPVSFLNSIKFAGAYTDYTHVEIEDGAIGTRFNNDSTTMRLTANHIKVDGWHGIVGVQASTSDYEAVGDEAFSPPTQTDTYALYVVEQKSFGNLTAELGARIERTEYEVGDTQIDLHSAAHDEEHEAEEAPMLFSFDDYQFTSTSFSAGANWEYKQGQSMALTVSRSERAPSQQELFSGGAHLSTQTYELGLVFDLDNDGEVGSSLQEVNEEVSTNIDLTFRKYTGSWGYTASFFYNQADDYIYQSDTGLIAEAGHQEHDESEPQEHAGEEAQDEHEEGLPVFVFNQADADIYGMEAEIYYDIDTSWRVEVFGDMIRAKLDNQDLPRIPPLRVGTRLSYTGTQLSGEIGATYNDEQDNTAPFESQTDSYTLLNANVQYEMMSKGINWVLFANADNLTDEEARVHTSFLKDKAPLPGRNFTVGVRALF